MKVEFKLLLNAFRFLELILVAIIMPMAARPAHPEAQHTFETLVVLFVAIFGPASALVLRRSLHEVQASARFHSQAVRCIFRALDDSLDDALGTVPA